MMQGITAEERTQALVLRSPILPELLPTNDPVRIVSELLHGVSEDDDDGCGCQECDGFRDEIADLESDYNDLEVFAQGVREALGLSLSTDLDDVLDALRNRLGLPGESA